MQGAAETCAHHTVELWCRSRLGAAARALNILFFLMLQDKRQTILESRTEPDDATVASMVFEPNCICFQGFSSRVQEEYNREADPRL